MIISELVAIETLVPHPRNYNRHSDRQLSNLADSLEAFGQFKNIVIDGNGRIIAGHGIVEAAKRKGMTHIEVKRYSHLSETEILSLLIADNELAHQAEADNNALRNLLEEIEKAGESVPGLDDEALEGILADTDGPRSNRRKQTTKAGIDESLTTSWMVEEGQLWKLGNHRLICGDSTNKTVLEKLIEGERIGDHMVVFADPPYGVGIVHKDGTIGGGGKVYAQIIGDNSTGTCKRFYQSIKAIGVTNFIL